MKVRRLLSLIAVVAASLVGREAVGQTTDIIRGSSPEERSVVIAKWINVGMVRLLPPGNLRPGRC